MRFEIGREKVDPHNCPRINDVDAIHHLWWIEKRSKWRHSDFSDRLLGEGNIIISRGTANRKCRQDGPRLIRWHGNAFH